MGIKYKVTIERLEDRYTSERLYEQLVEGDESIVSSVMVTVWRYLEAQKAEAQPRDKSGKFIKAPAPEKGSSL